MEGEDPRVEQDRKLVRETLLRLAYENEWAPDNVPRPTVSSLYLAERAERNMNHYRWVAQRYERKMRNYWDELQEWKKKAGA